MRSIRSAIVSRLVFGTAALLVVGAAGFTMHAKRLLTEQFDAAAMSKLRTFAALFEQEGNKVELDLIAEHLPEFAAGDDAEYFQVWYGDEELARSASLGEESLPRDPDHIGTEEEPIHRDLTLPDGRSGRAVGAAVRVRRYERTFFADPGPATIDIVMARSREGLAGAITALIGGASVGIIVLIFGGLALGRRVADRGLAPVSRLVRHVEGINDPTHASAFDGGQGPIELEPIARGLNQLVDRLAKLLRRERRTSANIAHELRTPVSELLVTAEVALKFGDEERAREALVEVTEIAEEMRRMIGTLLELSRLESGQTPLEREEVDLADLVATCWQPLADDARQRGLQFGIDGDAGAVHTDRGALAILLANLLGNAAEHAPEGTRVECELDGPTLLLSNSANGLDPRDLDKLTEPFWRADTAHESRQHAGLGLALARRIAEILGVDLGFAIEDGTFTAKLVFANGRA